MSEAINLSGKTYQEIGFMRSRTKSPTGRSSLLGVGDITILQIEMVLFARTLGNDAAIFSRRGDSRKGSQEKTLRACGEFLGLNFRRFCTMGRRVGSRSHR
jgi:hypothetical protein